jgi:chromosome segregation ATPase
VLVVDEGRPVAPGVRVRRRHILRVKWVAAAAFAVVFGCALAYLVNDEAQANARYDRSRASLRVTRGNVATATEQLAVARRELALVTAQVGSASTALNQDDSQLQAAQSALSAALAHVSHQTTQIGALHKCLGGVEQALNALAVNQQRKAILALSAVATSCTQATSGG